ncbi:MAG: cytochrome c nitrite reductase small subunit [Planctomycetota bacterium]
MLKTLATLLFLRFLAPVWRLPCFLMLGITAGMAFFVIHVSRAASYMSDEPETCMNCHVMTTQYLTWQHSSHARVATCTDCHVPHDNLFHKFSFKAQDGLWHSTVFTAGWEPQVIRISERAKPVVQANCQRCHSHVVEEVAVSVHGADPNRHCWDCHRETPHGAVRSLSAAPTVFQPRLPDAAQFNQDPAVGGRPPRPENKPKRNLL